MIAKTTDIKLKVLPVFFGIEHKYYYEGPCRFGKGDALKPGYDRLANAQKHEQFLQDVKKWTPDCADLLSCVEFHRTDDWDDSEEQWVAMKPSIDQADALVVLAGIDQLNKVKWF